MQAQPINVRLWQNFLRIAEVGSITRVAERLNLSQPALSRDIRALEAGFGIQLFHRNGRGLQLTPAGVILQKRAEAILEQLRDLPGEIKAASDEPTGEVAFGMPPSMSALVTARLVKKFRALYPSVRIRIREGSALQLKAALVAREIEFGIMSLPLAEPHLLTEPIAREQMYLIGPVSAKLSVSTPVKLAYAAAHPLILTPRPNSLRVLIEHAMERAGLSADVAIETDTHVLIELVSQSAGYTIGPGCSVASHQPRGLISAAPIKGLKVTWALVRTRESILTLGAERLIALIQAEIAQIVGSKHWPAAEYVYATGQKK